MYVIIALKFQQIHIFVSLVPQSVISIMQSPGRLVSGLDTVLNCTATVANGVSSSIVNVNWTGGGSLSDSPRVIASDVTNNGLQYTCSVSVDGFDEADNSDSVMIVINCK